MTQEIKKELSECRKCKDAGFPNTMIGFVKDPSGKTKTDGKPFWLLKNENMTDHVHRTPVVLPDIEEPNKPLPTTTENDKLVVHETHSASTIQDLIYAINSLVLATLATTEAERNIVKARIAARELNH